MIAELARTKISKERCKLGIALEYFDPQPE